MTAPHAASQLPNFASDNYAGIHPDVLAAIVEVNQGPESAYGNDPYTHALQERTRETFGDSAVALPVLTGTGANVTALQTMLPRWGAVIAAQSAHINTDEGGAPEHTGGIKLLAVPTTDGKLTPELVDREAWGWGDVHRAQPLVVSITQVTELGTVYTPDEIRALAERAHAHGMLLHMDGARISNAAAALDVPLRAVTSDAGVDVLSYGGTKNGGMLAEAVIVMDPDAAPGLDFARKSLMQLASKMRFLSAQLVALLTDDLGIRNAAHANAMARRLREGLERATAPGSVHGVQFIQPTQANSIFATLPAGAADRLRERFRFYDWNAARREVRWMCSFETTTEEVDAFVAEVGRVCRG